MNYIKSKKYTQFDEKMMGPNPIKLEEELLSEHKIPENSVVMDLGCGQGITSVFLAKEYNFKKVYATDLWSNPDDNRKFFSEQGLSEDQITPIKADITEGLPFEEHSLDAVVSVDSYNYFGRDEKFLNEKILPYVRKGGYIYIAIPGMKKDCHDNLPPELLLSWTSEQLDYMHDTEYWKNIVEKADGIKILSVHEMESNEEVWNDWLAQENEYAIGDRKSMEAGAGKYLNFIAIILKVL